MKFFKRINYVKLKPLQKEIYNFQIVSGFLAIYGFNCIKLADDWQGADFLACHIDGKTTLKVQLKSRVTINMKYQNKSLFIAFPLGSVWFMIEHDKLVKLARIHTSWLRTKSWNKNKGYSSKYPSKKFWDLIAQESFRLGDHFRH